MARNSDFQPALRDSWNVQLRVVKSMFIRETLTRFGRHNLGFLWLFVEPMIFTLGVTALWTATKSVHGSDLPILAFALTGYSSVLLWRNMPGRCIGALKSNLPLMYHRNIKVLDVYWARIFLEFGGVTISFSILSLIYVGVGWLAPPEDVTKVVAAYLLIAWFGSALAILLGAMSHQSEIVEKLWHPISYLVLPLSGFAFLVAALPPMAQQIVLYIPVVHGVEMLREGWFGGRARAIYDLSYLIPFNLALSACALMQVRRVAVRMVPE